MSKNNNELPVDKINTLAGILKEQGLTEIEIESDGIKIKVRKELTVSSGIQVATASPNPAALASPSVKDESLHEIKSPMVGTFYASSSPGAEAFVKVGDRIKKGDTICIVEAMKLMNELPSDIDGEIVSINVENGQAISFGQTIMKVKKTK